MSKLIAVWGTPDSGKTTFATKFARSIYEEYQSTVIVVYADNETPTLPVIFPNYKKEDMFSVGAALAKTDVTQEDVVKQDDRTLKDTLLPIVAKLTDVRIVNNELKTLLGEVKKEYWMMVCLVVCNIPLLYVLNKDWYDALMFTLPGKIVLAICGVVILITAVLMMKYTRPVEYDGPQTDCKRDLVRNKSTGKNLLLKINTHRLPCIGGHLQEPHV